MGWGWQDQAFREGGLGVSGLPGPEQQVQVLSPCPQAGEAARPPTRGVPGAPGAVCLPLARSSHVHDQALHPGPGGAAAPCPPGHEEARVWSRAVERLRGEGAARREHRGGRSQVSPRRVLGRRLGCGGVRPFVVGCRWSYLLGWSGMPSEWVCYPAVQLGANSEQRKSPTPREMQHRPRVQRSGIVPRYLLSANL